MKKKEREALLRSLETDGWVQPIVTNEEGLIADGQQRWEIAKEEGQSLIPIVRVDLTDAGRRILRQVLNKLRGKHIPRLDAEEYKKIVEAGHRQELINRLLLSERELIEALDNKPIDKIVDIDLIETDIEIGDIFTLGNHRLMCGDSQDESQLKQLINKSKIDCLLTDPPYGIDIVSRKGGKIGGDKPFGSITSPARIGYSRMAEAKLYLPVIGDDKPFDPEHLLSLAKILIIFGGNYFSSKLPDSPGWLIWDKTGGREWRDTFADCELVWTNTKRHARIYRVLWKGMLKDGDEIRYHPTQKPIKLITDILADYSKPKQIILDPYGGSGTTLISCEQTDRRCFMMEIDPRYCQIIIDRWEAYTGLEAEKILPNGDI